MISVTIACLHRRTVHPIRRLSLLLIPPLKISASTTMSTPPTNPDPASLVFIKEIHDSDASSIFEVEYHGKRYALKVFHDEGDPGYADDGRDLNRFRNEVKAYNALHTTGAGANGFVPRYYGSIDRLDPTNHEPWLDDFLDDEAHPQAILLELLENAESLNCVNYSKDRISKARESLAWVHNAFIAHNDIYPKNILIVPGEPERVLIVDFDVSITFPRKELIEEDIGLYMPEPIKSRDLENRLLDSFSRRLEEDQKEGLPPSTKNY